MRALAVWARTPRFNFFLGLMSLCGLFVACAPRETAVDRATREGTLLKGNGGDPEELDPQLVFGTTERNIVTALFEGLTTPNPRDLNPEPGVAERWQISSDGLTYTFYLRPAAQWSNGDALTAQDFLFSFQRILSPKLGSQYAYLLFPVRNARAFNEGRCTDFAQVGFSAIDPRTLQIQLEHPCPLLLTLLYQMAWMPVHPPTILKHGAIDARLTKWTRPEAIVSNGPFVLREWRPSQSVRVEKNPRYWDAVAIRLKAIVFFETPDTEAEERAFRAGQYHVTQGIPVNKLAVYRTPGARVLQSDPQFGTFFVRCNVSHGPLGDERVRRALSLALARDDIARAVLSGGQEPAFTLVPPGIPGYTAPVRLGEDVDQARRLLAEAGFPGGRGFPRLRYVYNTSESLRVLAEALQQLWRKQLGIDIELVNQEWKVFLNSYRQHDYDLCRGIWNGDYLDPLTFLDLWVTDGGNNHTTWSDPAFDALIAESAASKDVDARNRVLGQAEGRLLSALPMIPVYFGRRNYLMQPSVRGWFANPMDWHPYKGMWLERAP